MVINISKVIQIVDTVAGQDDKTKTRIVHGVQSHAGLDFMPLLHRNQNVCMLLHGRKDYGWPSSVVRALKDARDSKVDGMITTYMKKKDPMGEEHIDLDDKSRATAYYDAEVPMAMELSMPAFISKDGTKVKVTQVVVLTSPKRNDKVLIELSNPTITWLKHMCISAEGDESGDPGDDEADEAQMFELVKSWVPDKIKVVKSKRQQKHKIGYMYSVIYNQKHGSKRIRLQRDIKFPPDAEHDFIKRLIDDAVDHINDKMSEEACEVAADGAAE